MKFGKKHFLQCTVAAFAVLAGFTVYGADVRTPAVADKIVRLPMKQMALGIPKDTGNLLFSDSPEYATRDGMLYSDMVRGDSRMYFYHVNQTSENKKILVVASNTEDKPVDIYVHGSWYSHPSEDYYGVGRELSEIYYKDKQKEYKITVQPRSTALLDERLNDVVVYPDQLFSGIVDFRVDGAAQVSSVMMPAYEDPHEFMKRAFLLSSDDVKLRGRFKGKDRALKTLVPYTPKDGISYILLADGQSDPFLKGPDILDNRPSENFGNYGVDYTVTVDTKGKGPVHLYFNPIGGEYSGVVEVMRKHGGESSTETVGLPRTGHSMGFGNAYAIEYVTTFKSGDVVNIHFMPPGAANLPVRYILVPDEAAKTVVKDVTDEENRLKALLDSAVKVDRSDDQAAENRDVEASDHSTPPVHLLDVEETK